MDATDVSPGAFGGRTGPLDGTAGHDAKRLAGAASDGGAHGPSATAVPTPGTATLHDSFMDRRRTVRTWAGSGRELMAGQRFLRSLRVSAWDGGATGSARKSLWPLS